MGRATGWLETARWLTPNYRVVAIDQRGHGLSEKVDNAYTRDHYVNDVIAVIEQLQLHPTILIGHSMGALHAWGVAARRPDLVSGLVIEDMSVEHGPKQEKWKKWFESWPVPFESMLAVRQFFGKLGPGYADHFMEMMVENDDGYRPILQFEHLLQTVAGYENQNYWTELESVQCPTLVVRGEHSDVPREVLIKMAERLPNGKFVEIPNAGHAIHYDQPVAWRVVVENFLKELK
jgi:pimeloyl-ACP methyl ester carboxylesterase